MPEDGSIHNYHYGNLNSYEAQYISVKWWHPDSGPLTLKTKLMFGAVKA
jgi:fatty-acid desaturase